MNSKANSHLILFSWQRYFNKYGYHLKQSCFLLRASFRWFQLQRKNYVHDLIYTKRNGITKKMQRWIQSEFWGEGEGRSICCGHGTLPLFPEFKNDMVLQPICICKSYSVETNSTSHFWREKNPCENAKVT